MKAKIASLEKDVGLAQRLYKTEVESFANFEKKFKLATKHVLNNFAGKQDFFFVCADNVEILMPRGYLR